MAGKTLSEQIYDELYHDITEQRLYCGQKLTLNMLKERFGVSHTPIREALMRLTTEDIAAAAGEQPAEPEAEHES